ncbi:hypothetical protein B0H16DRAFT_1280224, partial [Mycena metata]
FDNAECIRLLQNKPGGLVHIMDDQARRASKKTDATMVEVLAKRWVGCVLPLDSFIYIHFLTNHTPQPSPSFTISHFNGSVTYVANGFLARNLDALNPDFLSLLR